MHFAIAVYDALIAINVPAEKAKAVVTALEHDMTTELATKADLRHLSESLDVKLTAMSAMFDLRLKAQTNSIVIRLGAIIIATFAGLEALHKFL